jgi:hypothetical protein
MRKIMICLANSKKYGQRCIAGIEVVRKPAGGWRIVKKNDKPQWLRPVSSYSNHGEVKESEVENIQLLDIVSFEMTQQVGRGYQHENVLFQKKSLQKISLIGRSAKNLDVLTDASCESLFGDTDRRILANDIHAVSHSLVFLKVHSIKIYYPIVYKTMSPRAKISFNNRTYDLPVTDVEMIWKLYENPNLLEAFDDLYCTFSLGVLFEKYHYKIAAGIIYV